MDLPINDKELSTIVSALRIGGDAALYQKLNTIKQIREENPGPRTVWIWIRVKL